MIKKYRLIFSICFLLIGIPQTGWADITHAAKIRQGNHAMLHGNLQKAEIIYNKLPNTSRLLFNKGYLASLKNDPPKADYYYQQIKNNPHVPAREKARVYYNEGNNQFRANQFAKAIQFYRQGLRLDPHNFQLKYNLELANHAQLTQKQKQKQSKKGDNNKQTQKQDQRQNQPNQTQQPKNQSTPNSIASQPKSATQKNAEKILDAFKQREVNTLLPRKAQQNDHVEKDW